MVRKAKLCMIPTYDMILTKNVTIFPVEPNATLPTRVTLTLRILGNKIDIDMSENSCLEYIELEIPVYDIT